MKVQTFEECVLSGLRTPIRLDPETGEISFRLSERHRGLSSTHDYDRWHVIFPRAVFTELLQQARQVPEVEAQVLTTGRMEERRETEHPDHAPQLESSKIVFTAAVRLELKMQVGYRVSFIGTLWFEDETGTAKRVEVGRLWDSVDYLTVHLYDREWQAFEYDGQSWLELVITRTPLQGEGTIQLRDTNWLSARQAATIASYGREGRKANLFALFGYTNLEATPGLPKGPDFRVEDAVHAAILLLGEDFLQQPWN